MFIRNQKKGLWRRLRDKDAPRRKTVRSKKHELKQVKREIKSKRREEHKQLRSRISEMETELKGERRRIKRISEELLAAEDPAHRRELEERRDRTHQEKVRLRKELRATKKKARAVNIERKRTKKRAQQEIFLAQRGSGATTEQRTSAGALPDFVIIGERKCGTSFLYHLLTQHPLVEPAAKKELHFFDVHFDLGVEWYRRCFPTPTWEDGRRTISGEGTPYMPHPYAPQRMAEVVPQARLIALLRNPAERTYSDYQQVVRKGRETRTFEEAIGQEKRRLPDEEGEIPGRQDHLRDARHGYLSRSIYVDQLLRWAEFFPREQLLVLKSEDFFVDPNQSLKRVIEFLELPEWEPEASELESAKRNAGGYAEGMDPATRRRLEEYFEVHNRRLYDFLGVDFRW